MLGLLRGGRLLHSRWPSENHFRAQEPTGRDARRSIVFNLLVHLGSFITYVPEDFFRSSYSSILRLFEN
jgi:hypothetical protein